jgi:peptidoglycan/LPS O-acetylase OafA/YrhL
MRPVKQLGVLSTHSLLFFAPASAFVGAAATLLHVSREGFLFISACMLTYAYYDLTKADLGRFWRRRLFVVGLPYLTWTLIYFAIGLPSFQGSAGASAMHLFMLILTGYSQLYFLVVLMQFYLLFPLVVWLLKRMRRHHLALLMTSLICQVGYLSAMHWGALPVGLTGTSGTREIMSYQFYLLAGCLAAVHYTDVHAWITSHTRFILAMTVATAAFAEGAYWLALRPAFHFLGAAGDAFMPLAIPFNIAAIALIYVIGVELVKPRHSQNVRRLAYVGSDNSYAVYLSQVMFLDILSGLGWKGLDRVIPWPFAVIGAVLIVFLAGCLLGTIVARTPLAMPLAGRHQVSWNSLLPSATTSQRDALLEDDATAHHHRKTTTPVRVPSSASSGAIEDLTTHGDVHAAVALGIFDESEHR